MNDGIDILEEKALDSRIKNIDNLKDKAIILIEEILIEMEDLDDYLVEEGEERSKATKMLGEIYDIIHGVNDYNMCYHVHDKMRKRLEDRWKAYIKERTGV